MIAIQATHPTFPVDLRYEVAPAPDVKRPTGFTEKHKCYKFTISAAPGACENFTYWTAQEPDVLGLLGWLVADYRYVISAMPDNLSATADVEPLVICLCEELDYEPREAFSVARALLANAVKLDWLLSSEDLEKVAEWLDAEGYL